MLTLMIRRCCSRCRCWCWWRHQTRSMIRDRRRRRRHTLIAGSGPGPFLTGAASHRRRPKDIVAGNTAKWWCVSGISTFQRMWRLMRMMESSSGGLCLCLHRNGQRAPYGFPLAGHFLANHVSEYRAHWIRKLIYGTMKLYTKVFDRIDLIYISIYIYRYRLYFLTLAN